MPLTANNLSVGYHSVPILKGINVCLNPGELAVLIGSNGSGKSTLLRTLIGAQMPISGEVLVDGESIENFSAASLSRKMAVVLTDRSSGGGLRVNELVAIGRHPHTGFFGRLSQQDKEQIERALLDVGLQDKANKFVAQLSDGERQKAMIARAIAQQTPILILDEPTSFLDVASRFEIMSLLATVSHRDNKSILLSTHDISAALAQCDSVLAIVDNKLESGTVKNLANQGILDAVFPNVVFDSDKLDFISKK